MQVSNSSVNCDTWLQLHGNWNPKKTVAKTNLFIVPIAVLCEIGTTRQAEHINHTFSEIEPIVHVFAKEGRGLTCLTCQTAFLDLTSQQVHFRSNFHRFNLRRNLKGHAVVTESDYETKFSSVSFNENDGKDNSDDESSEDEDDELTDLDAAVDEDDNNGLIPSSDIGGVYNSGEGSVIKKFTKGNGPVFVFRRTSALLEWEFSLSIAAFHSQSGMHNRFWNTQFNPWDLLCEQVQRVKKNTMSCVFLLRSGRFAGVVFEGEKIVIHKVLRRYTVRAKAGGGQSSHDNKGGKAKSAGAMLRRYGEQALKEDINEILILWSGHLQGCEAIHICAPKTMRSVFFDEAAGSPLRKDDPRISYVPFLVDRPTLDEAKFVHARCTSVIFTKRDKDANKVTFSGDVKSVSNNATNDRGVGDEEEEEEEKLLRGDETQRRDSRRKDKAAAKNSLSIATALASVALAECGPSRELLAVCESGNDSSAVRLLRALRDRYGQHTTDPADSDSEEEKEVEEFSTSPLLDASLTGSWDLVTILNSPDSVTAMSTPLHIASAKGLVRTVSLLLTLGADPTRMDVRGRPPYFLANDKDTRDAYRRYRGLMGEDRHNWTASGVAAPLTEDMERDKKSKEKEKKRRAAQRKKEQKQQNEIAAKEAKLVQERQKQLDVDMAKRRVVDAGQCGACSVSLFGIKSLDVYDRRCCSAKCVIALRRTLAAEAAMKRFGGK